MTGANGEVRPFEATVDLEPGSWTVAVFGVVSDGRSAAQPRLGDDHRQVTHWTE